MTQQAQDTENTSKKIKTLGRAWEDAAEPLQDALADRDAADDELDLFAKTTRHNLAGRDLTANRKEPYTSIFPDGVEYYTASPLDENKKRYLELHTRLEKHLPADDPLRAKLPGLLTMIEAFSAAYDAVKKASTDVAVARDELDQASASWRSFIVKLHGALTAMEDKAFANRFFPKARRTEDEDDPS